MVQSHLMLIAGWLVKLELPVQIGKEVLEEEHKHQQRNNPEDDLLPILIGPDLLHILKILKKNLISHRNNLN